MLDWTIILVALISALGGGGIGAALITWISQKDKVKAESDSIYGKLYEDRIEKLTCRAVLLEGRVEKLESVIETLRDGIEERDDMITLLRSEKKKLLEEREQQIKINRVQGQKLSVLKKENADLSRRVQDLETTLSAMNGGSNDP